MFDSVILNIVVIGGIVLAHAGVLLVASGVFLNRSYRG